MEGERERGEPLRVRECPVAGGDGGCGGVKRGLRGRRVPLSGGGVLEEGEGGWGDSECVCRVVCVCVHVCVCVCVCRVCVCVMCGPFICMSKCA